MPIWPKVFVVLLFLGICVAVIAILLSIRAQREFELKFRRRFARDVPKTDLERSLSQFQVDQTLGKIRSSDAFLEARELAKQAGMYVYPNRTDYLALVQGELSARD